MKKSNYLIGISLAIISLASFAGQNTPYPTPINIQQGGGAVVVVAGKSSAVAVGDTVSTYGRTASNGVINAQSGSIRFDNENWAQSAGEGYSASNLSNVMSGVVVSSGSSPLLSSTAAGLSVGGQNFGSANVAGAMQSNTYAGNATISEAGGNSSVSGEVRVPNGSVGQFDLSHGYYASGGDVVFGQSTGVLSMTIGATRPPSTHPTLPPFFVRD